MAKVSVTDYTGSKQELDVSLEAMRAAHGEGYTSLFAKWDSLVQTNEDQPTASQQVCASEHLYLNNNRPHIPNVMMSEILEGNQAVSNVQDATPNSRILFPPFIMAAMDASLRQNDYGVTGMFNSRAAITQTIANTKFERPIINYSRPEAARSRAIAQLAEPTSMAVITASDQAWKITGTSIGLTISDEALKATSLDLVALSMNRQAEVEAVERIESQLLAFYSGDTDLGMAALTGAVTAQSFDATIATAGKLTQTAWFRWLFANSRRMQVTTVITDVAGALAIENRTGRPTVNTDNGTSRRMDVKESIINPTWSDNVEVILSQDPNWPANTIVGFDKRYGYQIVNSSTLSYQAVEQYVMRRATSFRVDHGSIAHRLFDDAWTVMTLTV